MKPEEATTPSPSPSASLPPRTFRNAYVGLPGLLGLAVVVLDQASKWAIDRWYGFQDVTVVIPEVLNIVHVRNRGAAWGIFAEHTWLLGLLSLVCFVGLVGWFARFTVRRTYPALLAGALSGGILGNMLDRLLRSSVIDFIDVHWREVYHYPSFNVADMAICVSIVLLVADSLRGRRGEASA